MKLRLLELDTFRNRRIDLINCDGSIDSADVDHCSTFLAMQLSKTGNWLRSVEFQNESQIFVESLLRDVFSFFGKRYTLPVLSFVFAEIQNLKRPTVLDAKQSFSSGMYRVTAQITAYTTMAQLFGLSQCCS